MKRLLSAFAIALIFATMPALAEYKTCMTYCMKEHDDFAYCNAICKDASVKPEISDKPDSAPAVESDPIGSCPLTDEEKEDLVYNKLVDIRSEERVRNFSFVLSEQNPDLFEISVRLLFSAPRYRIPNSTRLATQWYWADCAAKGDFTYSEFFELCQAWFGPTLHSGSCNRIPDANEKCTIMYYDGNSNLIKKTVAGTCP